MRDIEERQGRQKGTCDMKGPKIQGGTKMTQCRGEKGVGKKQQRMLFESVSMKANIYILDKNTRINV